MTEYFRNTILQWHLHLEHFCSLPEQQKKMQNVETLEVKIKGGKYMKGLKDLSTCMLHHSPSEA